MHHDEIGEVIQLAIQAARTYRASPTPENRRQYELLFARLYNHFHRKVDSIARRIVTPLGTESDVEELRQEVFMQIHQKLHEFHD